MAKRQTKRKVTIKYVGRNPDDPHALLEAVEEVFRPRDIEICVQSATDDLAEPKPNEQLETKGREAAAQALDKRNAEVKPSEQDPKEAKRRLRSWIADRIAAGWKVFVKILPTLQKVKELFD